MFIRTAEIEENWVFDFDATLIVCSHGFHTSNFLNQILLDLIELNSTHIKQFFGCTHRCLDTIENFINITVPSLSVFKTIHPTQEAYDIDNYMTYRLVQNFIAETNKPIIVSTADDLGFVYKSDCPREQRFEKWVALHPEWKDFFENPLEKPTHPYILTVSLDSVRNRLLVKEQLTPDSIAAAIIAKREEIRSSMPSVALKPLARSPSFFIEGKERSAKDSVVADIQNPLSNKA